MDSSERHTSADDKAKVKEIVPDTNVWIHNLEEMKTIVANEETKGGKGMRVFLPTVVINELDGLKKGLVTGYSARTAADYLKRQIRKPNGIYSKDIF